MQNMTQSADTTSWNITEPEIMDTDKYLSSANAPDLEEDVRLCIKSGARKMILNCSGMTYMTGAGVRAILNMARMMQDVGGQLAVRGLSGQPQDIFAACGLDALIPTDDLVYSNTASIVSAA
jgi:stage II sporulation protein AA (anti-sigma F factor antagonist)